MDFVEQITDATERRKNKVVVFLDLQKAFDTVDHKLFLKNYIGMIEDLPMTGCAVI